MDLISAIASTFFATIVLVVVAGLYLDKRHIDYHRRLTDQERAERLTMIEKGLAPPEAAVRHAYLASFYHYEEPDSNEQAQEV